MRIPFIQDIIHQIEVGSSYRYVRIGLIVLLVGLFMFLYDWRAFRNMATQEAMDSAQVARNLSQGKGFTTLCVRPLSIFLVKRHNEQRGLTTDAAQLRGMHPDLANPPVYPVLLAGLMKVLPFQFNIPGVAAGISGPAAFIRSQPDFLIALFNQAVFLALVGVVFFVARRLFDSPVAWLSALVLFCSELFWRFSVSGLSTLLLMLIFTGLMAVLMLLEAETRTPTRGPSAILLLAAAVGVVVGVGGLTRYAFVWVIVPVVFFIANFCGPRRGILAVIALVSFTLVMTPWVVRNIVVCGLPFGTAGFAPLEGTFLYPEFRLQRSLEPDFSHVILVPFWIKLMGNLRAIVQNDLPRLGGTWVSAFLLPGLLVRFVKPSTTRIRYFLLACLPVLCVVQALGHTQLSEESPDINAENLLVLLAPMGLVYGVSLFFLLLDQVDIPALVFRYIIMVAFVIVVSFPLILVFLPPKTKPVVYPPYLPVAIQTVSGLMKENELIMSDIPWAVAWYGQRQAVWLTLHAVPDRKDSALHEDFFAINDYQKPINALYLTPMTMDSRFLSQWIQAGEFSWGSFILQTVLLKEEPPSFPLRKAPPGWLPYQLLLTDWERWRRTATPPKSASASPTPAK